MIGSSYLLKVFFKLCESPSNPFFPKGGPEKRRGENRWWRGCQKAKERKKGGTPLYEEKGERKSQQISYRGFSPPPLMAAADIFLLSRKKRKLELEKGGKRCTYPIFPWERETKKWLALSLSEKEGKGWVEIFLLSALSYLLSFSPCFYLFPFL